MLLLASVFQLSKNFLFLTFRSLSPSLIDPDTLASYWSAADLRNCTDIDTIQVSAGMFCFRQQPIRRSGWSQLT